MEIRGYQKDDYQGVKLLLEEEGWMLFLEKYKAAYTKALNTSLTYVAVEDTNIIGFIRAISDTVYLTFIGELIVSKNCRRKQIGSQLINHLKMIHPTSKIELISDADEFYHKNGFIKVGVGHRKEME